MNLFKTITMLFYPAAKRSCCHRNFELKIEFLDSKPMEIKMGKYLFLYKWLITQSVACFNYGIIFVYYVYIADNFVFLILIYIDSHFLLLWNIGNWRWIWLGTILLLILLGHFIVQGLIVYVATFLEYINCFWRRNLYGLISIGQFFGSACEVMLGLCVKIGILSWYIFLGSVTW